MRCARTGDGGTFRVPIPVSIGDADRHPGRSARPTPSTRTRRATCPPARRSVARITTWEQAGDVAHAGGRPERHVHVEGGCQQFRRDVLPGRLDARGAAGGPRAGAADARLPQQVTLSQAALDPADPFNYARFYMLRSLPGVDGSPQPPRPLLVATTAGDDEVDHGGGPRVRARGGRPALPAPGGGDDDARLRRLRDARRRSGTTWGGQLARPGARRQRRDGGRVAPGPDARERVRERLRHERRRALAADRRARPPARTPSTTPTGWARRSQTYGQQHGARRCASRASRRRTSSDAATSRPRGRRASRARPSPTTERGRPNAPLVASVTAYLQSRRGSTTGRSATLASRGTRRRTWTTCSRTSSRRAGRTSTT